MATKTTVLTVIAATGMAALAGILAFLLKTRTRQPFTLDESDDMRHHRHHEVRMTEFPPRSHAGPEAASDNGQQR
jgi:hypothetical protein